MQTGMSIFPTPGKTATALPTGGDSSRVEADVRPEGEDTAWRQFFFATESATPNKQERVLLVGRETPDSDDSDTPDNSLAHQAGAETDPEPLHSAPSVGPGQANGETAHPAIEPGRIAQHAVPPGSDDENNVAPRSVPGQTENWGSDKRASQHFAPEFGRASESSGSTRPVAGPVFSGVQTSLQRFNDAFSQETSGRVPRDGIGGAETARNLASTPPLNVPLTLGNDAKSAQAFVAETPLAQPSRIQHPKTASQNHQPADDPEVKVKYPVPMPPLDGSTRDRQALDQVARQTTGYFNHREDGPPEAEQARPRAIVDTTKSGGGLVDARPPLGSAQQMAPSVAHETSPRSEPGLHPNSAGSPDAEVQTVFSPKALIYPATQRFAANAHEQPSQPDNNGRSQPVSPKFRQSEQPMPRQLTAMGNPEIQRTEATTPPGGEPREPTNATGSNPIHNAHFLNAPPQINTRQAAHVDALAKDQKPVSNLDRNSRFLAGDEYTIQRLERPTDRSATQILPPKTTKRPVDTQMITSKPQTRAQRDFALEEVLSVGSVSTHDRVSASQAAAPAAAASSGSEPARQVIQQIASHFQTLGSDEIEITLNPRELGHVRMVLAMTENGLTVALTVDRTETFELMRRHMDLAERTFRDLGYADLSFDLTNGQKRTGSQMAHDLRADSGATEEMPENTHVVRHETPQTHSGGLDIRI